MRRVPGGPGGSENISSDAAGTFTAGGRRPGQAPGQGSYDASELRPDRRNSENHEKSRKKSENIEKNNFLKIYNSDEKLFPEVPETLF